MVTTQKRQIKALIELLAKESGQQAVFLRQELSRIMKQEAQALHEVIEQDFHSSVPAALVHNMEEVCWEDLTQEIEAFSTKINPSLEEALSIVTRFVNPAVKAEEVTSFIHTICQHCRTAKIHDPFFLIHRKLYGCAQRA